MCVCVCVCSCVVGGGGRGGDETSYFTTNAKHTYRCMSFQALVPNIESQ